MNVRRLRVAVLAMALVPALAIGQPRITPAAGSVAAVTTGGTAVTALTGPANGCYITNPLSATDQNIMTAEALYVNPVTTATTTGRGTTVSLAPGQTWFCPAYSTRSVSVNAATSSHAFVVVRW